MQRDSSREQTGENKEMSLGEIPDTVLCCSSMSSRVRILVFSVAETGVCVGCKQQQVHVLRIWFSTFVVDLFMLYRTLCVVYIHRMHVTVMSRTDLIDLVVSGSRKNGHYITAPGFNSQHLHGCRVTQNVCCHCVCDVQFLLHIHAGRYKCYPQVVYFYT